MIASDRAGRGLPLLLLHGLGGERHVWDPLMPALTARADVMRLDLPGFGGSAALPGDVSPPALARAVAAHLDAHAFAQPHVVGNSLGGWIALELARLGRARSVTALCPAGFWRTALAPLPPGPRRRLELARPLIPLALAVPALRRRALGSVMRHPERLGYRDAVRIAAAYAGGPGYRAVQTAMRAHRFEDADGIAVAVTLVWAEHDTLVRPERVPFTPTRTVQLADAGHVPMWDRPEEIARLILEDAL